MKRRIFIVCLALVFGFSSFVWGAEKKMVRIWHTETEPQSVRAFQQIIDDFEKLHPDIQFDHDLEIRPGDLNRLTVSPARSAGAAVSQSRTAVSR